MRLGAETALRLSGDRSDVISAIRRLVSVKLGCGEAQHPIFAKRRSKTRKAAFPGARIDGCTSWI
jgi:hypothetical protein